MLTFILFALSVTYITYLIVEAEFPPIQFVRDKVISFEQRPVLSYLLTCAWCMGWWVALVLSLARIPFIDIDMPVLFLLATPIFPGILLDLKGLIDGYKLKLAITLSGEEPHAE